MEFVLHSPVENVDADILVVSHMRVIHLQAKKKHGELQVVDNHAVVHVLPFNEENVNVELFVNLVMTWMILEPSQISLQEWIVGAPEDLVMPGREANVIEGPPVGSVMEIMVRHLFVCTSQILIHS